MRRRIAVLPVLEGLGLLALLLLPLALEDFGVIFATRVLILCLLALSFDLVWGHAGIMSFGQALFFGAGAYGVALIGRDLDLAQAAATLPVAALVGGGLALLFAWFLLLGRQPSIIFVSLGTLTGSYAAERLVNASEYLGGRNGISGVPVLQFGDFEFLEGPRFYYLALGILAVVYVLCRLLVRSQFGLVLAGIRDDEKRLAFLGYRVPLFKAAVFGWAGLVAGLGGGLYAYHEGFAGPVSLGMQLSTMAVLYALFGGTGTLAGAVVGTFAIEGLSLGLSDLSPSFWPIALGLLLLLVIVFQRTGLLGFVVPESERVGRFGRPPRGAPAPVLKPREAGE
ncbi:branched-chain amino acid ABC transporter permease [Paracraurococcus ruber]|uniref:Branched-chain amino acid ABC transporter permease n=1 Tax=Paracraurococcus ruber TaxID=77675 RepID=A0ABS1CRB3_9PROT|nr:branched-chain amino acid ABC transporter permease [Paracraurococcus ruber]MBK1656985.1 branched-chain amino acid ABC transporter permease [Paracraurococcus ruber]TDG34318.1 branched-chain amino acid ABC transporter permease [Paracraurococcus ruber]